MSPYREPAPPADSRTTHRRLPSWTWRPVLGVGGMLTAGLMHDVCAPGREGVCWAAGVVALLLAFLSTAPPWDDCA